ncbi:hypothetical protein AC138_06885 [Pseudomonas putida]|nr:hypothetical protein AC138_06885 [Pseudomonas putida]KMY29863.1 hypothetical protein AA993_22320 [Pseudomonas putida]
MEYKVVPAARLVLMQYVKLKVMKKEAGIRFQHNGKWGAPTLPFEFVSLDFTQPTISITRIESGMGVDKKNFS